jgi:hypothetical protein
MYRNLEILKIFSGHFWLYVFFNSKNFQDWFKKIKNNFNLKFKIIKIIKKKKTCLKGVMFEVLWFDVRHSILKYKKILLMATYLTEL